MFKLSTKMNKRIFATIIGIAFCVTYLAGTTSMARGLHNTTDAVASGFDQGPAILCTQEDLTDSMIEERLLPGNNTTFVAFCFSNVTITDNQGHSDDIYMVSIWDPEDIFGLNMTDESTCYQVLIGIQLQDILADEGVFKDFNYRYTLKSNYNFNYTQVDGQYSSGSILPDDWLIVPRHVTNYLRPEMVGNYSFLLVLEPEMSMDQEIWGHRDIVQKPTSGVIGFFREGIYQVEGDLWTVILLTGSMIALLAYCIISIETEYNAPTIRILRGIGATRAFTVRLFMMKACFITLVGGVLGTAMGFCAASAVASVSGVLGVMTLVTPVANLTTVAVPIISSLVSGMVGGIWPAVKAAKMFSVRGAQS